MIKFPYSRPVINSEDIKLVNLALKDQYLSGGKFVKRFEEDVKKKFDARYSVICNSGTAALHLTYTSLGVKKGSVILTSPITFLATANAATLLGAEVVFADIDPNTGLLTAESIENKIRKIKKKIDIITVVHLGGRVCDMQSIYKVSKKYGCYLVEDACHAPGAYYLTNRKDKIKVGSCKYSIASTFSFHAIKHATMGEGGCITTNNKKLAANSKLLLNHGMIKEKKYFKIKTRVPLWYYECQKLGWNYRASDINCALGISQLKRLNKSIKKREYLVNLYKQQFKNQEFITIPENPNKISNAWHLFSINLNIKKIKKTKDHIARTLLKKSIGTQVHYIPIFLHPLFKKKYSKNSYKNAMIYYENTLSLPLYTSLTERDIKFISKEVIKAIHN
ncbi:UDP-4-amino-4,6-dideoxy-N-acetyl-beta-L-altrosamine transaminase [Alphaproteobacteria bacterium]|nr:UDP-4-amino-4,6-dideoxy-N-acetyl-beta-L-altrosamine transaminase [Alphaproteobacteria bacterium]